LGPCHLSFPETLESGDIKKIRAIPKTDLHNHCLMGGRITVIEKFSGKKLERFKPRQGSIHELDQWIENVYRPVLAHNPNAFRQAVEAAFLQARSDGIRILEMSIDVAYGVMFRLKPAHIVETLQNAHRTIAPDIDFRPELGFIRGQSIRKLFADLDPYFDFNFFRSIDLYDDELAQPIRNFKEIFRFAKKSGLKCKAHVGEFGDADSIKEAVEELELDAVQHGIAAASSPGVMHWLADNNVPLNVCPTSNIRLKRARSYKTHPIRILFDHGIKVTVNTDDVMVFGMGVSEQYRALYKSGVFTAKELDLIRRNGFS
jgi:adenosine deaminase